MRTLQAVFIEGQAEGELKEPGMEAESRPLPPWLRGAHHTGFRRSGPHSGLLFRLYLLREGEQMYVFSH